MKPMSKEKSATGKVMGSVEREIGDSSLTGEGRFRAGNPKKKFNEGILNKEVRMSALQGRYAPTEREEERREFSKNA